MYRIFTYRINIYIKFKFKRKINKNIFITSDFFQLNNLKKLCFLIFILYIYENYYSFLNFNFKKLEIYFNKKFFLFSEEQFLKKFLLK